jgi:epoxide hydrolase 4
MAHRWVDVHGLRLHCVEAGTGPLVVLLHGFPEFWYAWRHQLPALADAGYRVVAPDLPGYNTSDKPPRVRDYRPRVLAQEMADLIAALGADSAAVAGHDWGGGLAWLVAMHHPKRVQRLVVLNAPHPLRFLKGLGSPRQLGVDRPWSRRSGGWRCSRPAHSRPGTRPSGSVRIPSGCGSSLRV